MVCSLDNTVSAFTMHHKARSHVTSHARSLRSFGVMLSVVEVTTTRETKTSQADDRMILITDILFVLAGNIKIIVYALLYSSTKWNHRKFH